MKICIAYNDYMGKKEHWIDSLKLKGINYMEVDLSKNDWLDRITSVEFDIVIVIPNSILSYQKQLFDERLYVMKYTLDLNIYPSYEELILYENKRMLSYWLKANNLPSPETHVYYNYKDAIHYVESSNYPLVVKSNIGAAGSGVHILKSKQQAISICKKTFHGTGLPRRKGPNFQKKGVYKRILKKIFDRTYFKAKLQQYSDIQSDKDRRDLLFQEYIPHQYEWKNVRIGDSFFSHKKIVHKNKASGTGDKIFCKPPESLLDFIKSVTDRYNFKSLSIDVFEISDGVYYINEVQTYFGQPYDYLMAIDDIPGRYIFHENEWIYEEGNFNTNHSCDLRLEHAIELYNERKK